jgi:acyl-CoA dehydrogenase
VNFDFSPEQHQFREQIRRFLRKSDSLSQARSILDGKVQHYSAPIWKGLAEMSVQAIAIPEEHAGIGLGALELSVAAEEIGRALAPVPFLSSVCLCAEAIRLFGSGEQQAKWLPGLASGEVIGTWAETDHPADEASVRFGALSGTKVPVLDGMVAQIAVVVMRDATGAPGLLLCDLTQSAVQRQPVKTVDPTRPAARLTFAGAAAERLAESGSGAWKTLIDRAAVLLAFEQLGSAESALAMACAYVQERAAFG